ncbi:MAG: hypothetical protein IJ848_03945 [Alphaproteobacteria bacterium]|nr:hypothetical protein [Alphaproteobacteria bacterium]
MSYQIIKVIDDKKQELEKSKYNIQIHNYYINQLKESVEQINQSYNKFTSDITKYGFYL